MFYPGISPKGVQTLPVPLVGGSNAGIDVQADSQRSINLFPVKIEREGEKQRWHLQGTPGLVLFDTMPDSPIRGMHEFDGRAFVVAGAGIYEVYSDGTDYLWGSLPSTTGKVSITDLADIIVIGDNSGFFSLTLSTGIVAAITSAPIGRFCFFFRSRVLYVERDSGRVFYSDLIDPVTVDPLSFFTAESLQDNIVSAVTTEDQIWLLGEDSAEPWYDSGDATTPFVPIQGGVVYSGCLSGDTALRLDNSVWWVEQDKEGQGVVRRTSGFTPVRVSTAPVERFTQTATNLSAYSYQEQGHSFYVLNADEGTWAYDIKEQEWHERAWLNNATGEQERARPECHIFAFGKHLVSDYTNTKLYEMKAAYYTDAGDEIRRTRVTGHVDLQGRNVIVDELYIDFAGGVGLDGSGQGTDPQCMLRYAVDGVSFSDEISASIGAIGQYGTRVRYHRLGMGRDWVFEISVSDPVKCVMLGAEARVRVGRR